MISMLFFAYSNNGDMMLPIIMVFTLLCNLITIPQSESSLFNAYCVMEVESGNIVASHQKDIPYPMGNLTQVMSLCVIYDAINNQQIKLSDMIMIKQELLTQKDSFLQVGELYSIQDLITYILHTSSYDAMNALVNYMSQEEQSFVTKMNQLAKDLNLTHTHFHNPYGYNDVNHYASAYDLAKITQYLLKIGGSSLFEISRKSEMNQTTWMASENELLKQYQGCDFMKMSKHLQNQYSMIASANQKGVRSIVVGLYASDKTKAYQQVLQYFEELFQQYQRITLIKKDEYANTIPIYQGNQSQCTYTHPALQCTILKDETLKVAKVQIQMEPQYAPITKKQKIGTLKVTLSNHKTYEVPLYAKNDIQHQSFFTFFIKFLYESIF